MDQPFLLLKVTTNDLCVCFDSPNTGKKAQTVTYVSGDVNAMIASGVRLIKVDATAWQAIKDAFTA